MTVAKTFWVTKDLCKKNFYQIITWNKEHSSKQAVPTHTWGKKISAATFEGL